MMYPFSYAIRQNIDQTYSYAYVKGAHNYGGAPEHYKPIEFFHEYLKTEPFKAFMALDRFAFQRTLNELNKYGVPYTEQQEYRARIYYEVTKKMASDRSDSVSMYVDGDIKGTGIVKLTDNYLLTTTATVNVARFIKSLPRKKQTDNLIYESKINELLADSKEQMRALTSALQNHISCVIGRAGTGKSYVTAEIVNQLRLNGKKTAILAPTHKAKEALQEKMRFGEVKTIHSFVHNPFDCDVIVIDEAGMLSTPLFNQLVDVYQGQQIVFIGDKNQLPPIQYGRPFELIQEQFATAELRQNKRSEARDIISLGNQILGIPQNANLTPENISVTSSAKKAFEQGAEVILTFTNPDVKRINEEQRIKQGVNSIHPGFKIGEKIISITNYKNKFYNGQLFEVVGFNTIRDISTKRVYSVSSANELDFNFEYAYALTIHKSQGSEWDVVGYQPSNLDTENLAYVAVTRAKKKLIIINGLNEHYRKETQWRHLHEDYSI